MGLITGVQLMKHVMKKKNMKQGFVRGLLCHPDIDECQISPFELHC